MGRSQREKGKRGERALVDVLKRWLPEIAHQIRRGWQSRMGSDDPDVVGVPGCWFESKCGAQPNPRAALKQALADKGKGDVAIAVVRDDRCEPFVVMRLDDFMPFLRAWLGYARSCERPEINYEQRQQAVGTVEPVVGVEPPRRPGRRVVRG